MTLVRHCEEAPYGRRDDRGGVGEKKQKKAANSARAVNAALC